MNKQLYIIAGLCLVLSANSSHAQAPGSLTAYGGASETSLKIGTGSLWQDQAESTYIGPGTYTIDGIWEIYSKNVFIDPAAVIIGNGTIKIYDAATVGGAGGATFMDGNNSEVATEPHSAAIGVNIKIYNTSGVKLGQANYLSGLDSRGFTNLAHSSLYVGKDLELMSDGAHITLGNVATGDLRFDSDATITGYSSNRMVITSNDAITSHVVKDAGGASFTYPVGIAAGDYTPAQITGNGKYHVSVQSATAPSSTSITDPTEGINRVWHIYQAAPEGTATSLTLQHNTTTNGINYNDNIAFITRNMGAGIWSSSSSSDYVSSGVHTNTAAIPSGIPVSSGSDGAFLSKTSDAGSPLPIKLISFDAVKKGNSGFLTWETAQEKNSTGFEIERSSTAVENWQSIGFVNTKSKDGMANSVLKYEFNDNRPVAGTNYYRLKSLSNDQKMSLSAVRMLQFEKTNTAIVSPNPATDYINISGINSGDKVSIADITGRIVYRATFSGTDDMDKINISALHPGVYTLSIQGGKNRSQVYKILKK